MEKLKGAIIGLGGMGQGHLGNYKKLIEEGLAVEIVALCDIDEEKLYGKATQINLSVADMGQIDESVRKYTDYNRLLEEETGLDFVDIVLPTYLHAEVTVKALEKGLHVLCEKPMALTPADCDKMVAAAKKAEKTFMIAQCLRFWPAYEVARDYVDNKQLGGVVDAFFYRGGGTPLWSYQNWYLKKEKSGGAIMDQHIHDVDMANWLFGKPEKVSTLARNVIPGSGYDTVVSQYFYPDGKVVCTQNNWVLNGGYDFQMNYRITFERGNINFERGEVRIHEDGKEPVIPALPAEYGYYYELVYFLDCVEQGKPVLLCTPESTADTIRIVAAEIKSADEKRPANVE